MLAGKDCGDRDEVAGVHSVETMEESIDAGVEMHKVDFCHMA